MGGGNNTGMMIGMIALGAIAPYAAGVWAKGAALTAGSGVAAGSAAGTFVPTGAAGLLTQAGIGLANMGWMGGAMMGAGAATMLDTPEAPQMPDYGQGFSQQQANMDFQNSFGRRSGAELEDMLLNGDEQTKNLAHSELTRRGEDSNRLLELSTRNERTAEDQANLDQYLEDSKVPSTDELDLLMAQLNEERLAAFNDDVEKEQTRLKQISAGRGTLDSNRNDQLNLSLAEAAARNRGDIRSSSQNQILNYQQGLQGIRDQGLNRLLKGAGYADTMSRYNIGATDAERKYQEAIRNANTQDQRNLAFQQFQANNDRNLALYRQQSEDRRNTYSQRYGVLGSVLGNDNFNPFKTQVILLAINRNKSVSASPLMQFAQ